MRCLRFFPKLVLQFFHSCFSLSKVLDLRGDGWSFQKKEQCSYNCVDHFNFRDVG